MEATYVVDELSLDNDQVYERTEANRPDTDADWHGSKEEAIEAEITKIQQEQARLEARLMDALTTKERLKRAQRKPKDVPTAPAPTTG